MDVKQTQKVQLEHAVTKYNFQDEDVYESQNPPFLATRSVQNSGWVKVLNDLDDDIQVDLSE